MDTIITKLKDITLPLVPISVTEIILFAISITLIVVTVTLIYYTNVQLSVRKDSRCYRDKQLYRPGVGIYKAVGSSVNGDEIFEVSYDIGAKSYEIKQVCRNGPIQLKISIPVYDLQTRTPQMADKIFECESDFGVKDKGVIYSGYPGIVKFMRFDNTEFFDSALEN
jgi:hypothetical protein